MPSDGQEKSLLHRDVESLKALLDERDRRYGESFDHQSKQLADLAEQIDQRFDATNLLITQNIEQVKRETMAAQQAAKEAIAKQEKASEDRFASINEFRQTLSDQTQTFMPRSEAEGRFSTLNTAISQLRNSESASEGKSVGVMQGWNILAVVFGMVMTAVAAAASVALIFKSK